MAYFAVYCGLLRFIAGFQRFIAVFSSGKTAFTASKKPFCGFCGPKRGFALRAAFLFFLLSDHSLAVALERLFFFLPGRQPCGLHRRFASLGMTLRLKEWQPRKDMSCWTQGSIYTTSILSDEQALSACLFLPSTWQTVSEDRNRFSGRTGYSGNLPGLRRPTRLEALQEREAAVGGEDPQGLFARGPRHTVLPTEKWSARSKGIHCFSGLSRLLRELAFILGFSFLSMSRRR